MSPTDASERGAATADAELVAARTRLCSLGARGADRWDPAGLQLVERLLTGAAAGRDTLQTQLLGRALEHLAQLEQDFAAAHERAARAAARLEAQGGDPERVRAALDAGELGGLLRAVRRAPHARPRLRDELRDGLGEQLDAQARARGVSSPGVLEAPQLGSSGPLMLATSLYRDAAAGAAARLTLAKTAASVPPDAGRYHPLHVGARTLQVAAGTPGYLKALLSRLETLSVLWQHGLDD